MAKGGNNQRSNGSRFSKPYDPSNSFVKKVALRVSDYLGGWFGTPMKSTGDSARNEGPPVSTGGGDTPITTASSSHRRLDALDSLRESTALTRQCFNDVDVAESPAKRIKMESKGKYDIDFPISPIPSTSSGLFQTNINHNFNIQNSEDYLNSGAGPSGLQNQRYAASSTMVQSSTTSTDVKANGAADDHSESSESTSGCSSLVPQSDRLSQSAYACTSRKKNLEEKLSYARQLKQSRASLYLNRSIPVGSDGSGSRRKPSFDISAYGSPMFDKSSVRERMVNSPFYTGQTSYGGASAYKRSRSSSIHAQRNLSALDRREGLQLQVKPSHHGSTEDLSNMSHTAKRILEALEQFSTPINDAKRIPINAMNPPLGSKRRRFEDLSDTRVKLSTPKSPLNPNAGPSTSGLTVPTVPDLLKLKRLERIQNSTAAARQVAVQNQEYSLPVPPVEVPATKRTGKIVTKLKDKDKEVCKEKLEEVNLPKVPLPITTLPKFDIKLPPAFTPPAAAAAAAVVAPPAKTTQILEKDEKEVSSKKFTFSPPIPVSAPSGLIPPPLKNNFTFSHPLIAEANDVSSKQGMKLLTDFMSSDALSKLKRKSTSDNNVKSLYEVEPAKELKTGSVMDILKKSADSDSNKKIDDKSVSDTWECSDCLCRNLKDSKNCVGCSKPKANPASAVPKSSASSTVVNETKPITVGQGFGDRFKPPSDSWTCKECFVTNSSSSTKCVACETPKPGANTSKEKLAEVKAPPPIVQPIKNNFGDMFKKKAGEWSCSVCMIINKEADTKCAACETPKPGAKVEKSEPPKFNFGIPPGGGGFKFGIDKADIKFDEVKTSKPTPNGPQADNPPAVATSFGTFTFGIPKNLQEEKKEKDSVTNKVTENTPEANVSAPIFSSTPIVSKPETSLWNNAGWAKPSGSKDDKKEENKLPDIFKVDAPKADTPSKTLFKFGSDSKKDASNKFGGNNPPDSNPVKFLFGQSSVSSSTNSIEVSSSTTGFSFGSVKTTQNSDVTKPSSTLDFLNANKTEPPKFGAEVKEVSSAPTFGSTTSFNDSSKINFGKSTNSVFGSIKSSNPIFGNPTPSTLPVTTTASAPFQSSVPTFGTASFNGPTSTPAPSSTFGALGAATTTTAAEPTPTPTFGSGGIPSFGNNQGPFGSSTTVTPAFQNPAPAPTSGFGVFGTSASTFGSSNFNSNPTPAPAAAPTAAATPAFGSAFSSSTSSSKQAPFLFGANPATTTAAAPNPVPVAPSSSEVFTFGAAKPETKPFGSTFGQNGQQPFSFGAPATNNVFGGFAAPKTESAFGTSNPGFGNNAPMNFGMNSAPPAFGSTAPSFEFGSNNPQSQPAPTFQFGAKPQQQPASAPAATAFSLSVPQSFNFTGGQTPTFSADPSTAQPMPQRRVIKAVRRTQR